MEFHGSLAVSKKSLRNYCLRESYFLLGGFLLTCRHCMVETEFSVVRLGDKAKADKVYEGISDGFKPPCKSTSPKINVCRGGLPPPPDPPRESASRIRRRLRGTAAAAAAAVRGTAAATTRRWAGGGYGKYF